MPEDEATKSMDSLKNKLVRPRRSQSGPPATSTNLETEDAVHRAHHVCRRRHVGKEKNDRNECMLAE